MLEMLSRDARDEPSTAKRYVFYRPYIVQMSINRVWLVHFMFNQIIDLTFLWISEKKSVKESTLKREVQAVKSILQGGSSSMRDHQQSVQERQSHDDKTKLKKRNILEQVFKKPSNAKEIGKPAQKRSAVIDKFELECSEILKVNHSSKSSFVIWIFT